jgi:hypothetical protein
MGCIRGVRWKFTLLMVVCISKGCIGMLRSLKIGVCGLLALLSLSANAETAIGRKVKVVGCHNTDGTCYVILDGAAFGSSQNCSVNPTTEFRFDNGDTVIGRRAYASFLTALVSGRPVTVTVSGCSRQGWPRLHYFNVE